ncbi:MAG: metallophosphoesterase [Chitinophagales bacterium]|nr:metallophosphoesterase [Chitinophagales bacterium]
MKIQYCSDLHLEFPANKRFLESHPLERAGEVLILAGDIIPLGTIEKHKTFLDRLADSFEMVYWVPGNHEYYGFDAASLANPLLEKVRSNIWLVNNKVVEYKEVNIICTTLWSKISIANEWEIQRSISDFHAIRWGNKRFTPREFNELHQLSLKFLNSELTNKMGQKNIVVTHHVPTLLNYPEKYRFDLLNEAFAVELYDTILGSEVDTWIYGHHHNNIPAFEVGKTKLLTNQLGYVELGEEAGFNAENVIEIIFSKGN